MSRAVAHARRALAAAPEAAEPLFLPCALLLRQGDPAANQLLPRLDRHPAFAPGWIELGQALLAAGQPKAALVAFDRAIAAYRAALGIRPDFHAAALNLGVACQDVGDLRGAMDAYGIALRLEPQSFGRVVHALTCGPTGGLWLDLDALRRRLAG